jgi:hypothetical protein
MRGLSNSDLKILSSSPFVLKITDSHIVFTEHFKQLVLESFLEGMTRLETFNSLLGVNCFNKKFVDDRLGSWRRKLRADGDLIPNKRGRRKSIENMGYDEMKAEIAYQKEIIAHLKKLKGLADDEL